MNKIIAMVGMTGSGKSIASKHLESLGYQMIYFGGLTYERMQAEGIEYTVESDKQMRVQMRKDYGMGAYAILSMPKIKVALEKGDVVIDDLYSWAEYEELQKEFGDNIILICVVADKNIRYERLRTRETRSYTKEEAIGRDLNELGNLDKGRPISYADYFIFNNGTTEEYIKRLDEILKKI